MTKHIEDRLEKIPVVNVLIRFLKHVKLPGFEGMSIYDLFEMYAIGIVKGALTTRASAIAFSFFTAIFPFMLFIIIIIPYVPVDDFQTHFLTFLNSILPPQTSEFFNENIFENISKNEQGGLLSTVFLLAIVLMANGVSNVFTGFEYSFYDQVSRSAVKQYLYALGVALILVALLIFTIVVLGYIQIYVIQKYIYYLDKQGYDTMQQSEFMISIVTYLFVVIIIYLATATLYYFGTKEGKDSKFFSIGALLTTLLVMVTSFLFGIYVDNFARYNELYGSIGALLILLFYVWLNSNILLLGFELNVSLRRLKRNI